MAENSSATPSADKPVIVRVKRKVSQSALDAFWLEINERPLKRPLIDFGKLSISDASSSKVEELNKQKILVRHVETVTSSKDAFDVLRSFVPNSSGELKSDEKNEERRRSLKTVDKQDQLLVKARQMQEVLSRYARFEQIWRSRQEKKAAPENEAIYDMCRLYDVVRVDVEEHVVEVQNQKDTDMDDCKMMADFLPLLREVLPTAADEIEHDIHGVMSKQASSDGYVYDVYAVEKDVNEMEPGSTSHFPLVQVDDNDEQFYDGPDDSECESDDSNAENNPLNDYPDEEDEDEDGDEDEDEDEDEDDDDEATSRSSDESSEGESKNSGSESEELKSESQVSYEYEDSELYEWSDCADQTLEDSEGDEETY